MKNIYIAVIVLATIFTIGQLKAQPATLDTYYMAYSGINMPESERLHQGKKYKNCLPYGDETVGYYKTLEEYNNQYDPALRAVD